MLEYEKAFLVRIIEDSYDPDEYKTVSRQDIPEMAELLLVAFWGVIGYFMEKESLVDKEKLQQTIDLVVYMLLDDQRRKPCLPDP